MKLTEFLLARIAEDEEAARAATPGPWKWDNDEFVDAPRDTCKHRSEWTDHGPNLVTVSGKQRKAADGEEWFDPDDVVISATGYDASSVNVSTADAAHIARWDPARVLAESEAKRRIVEVHKPYRRIYGLGCENCLQPRHVSADVPGWPCESLRLLAAVYADHPDYDPAWRP